MTACHSVGRGATEFIKKRSPVLIRFGVELNRDFLRCDLAKIHRHREGPGCAVSGHSCLADVKVRASADATEFPSAAFPAPVPSTWHQQIDAKRDGLSDAGDTHD